MERVARVGSQVAKVTKDHALKASAWIGSLAGGIGLNFRSKVTASRSRNRELGEAASLMQYIIGLIGWVTRTPSCESFLFDRYRHHAEGQYQQYTRRRHRVCRAVP
jgi:hypothetical protein